MEKYGTKIIAHRGFSSQYPENTLIAFEKAIEIGADYIELDVHKTRDDVLVVIHDQNIARTSDHQTGEISNMNLADLKAINFGYPKKFGDEFNGEKIATLKEVLEFAKGKIKVCIEIKVDAAEEEILQLIEHFSMENEVILFCFQEEVLKKIKILNEHISILYLVELCTEKELLKAKAMDCFAIGVGNTTSVDQELMDRARSKNLKLWQWTIDNNGEMKRLLELGLDGLITNKPDQALKFLNH